MVNIYRECDLTDISIEVSSVWFSEHIYIIFRVWAKPMKFFSTPFLCQNCLASQNLTKLHALYLVLEQNCLEYQWTCVNLITGYALI